MKLMEAIQKIDELKHNTFSTGDKIAWLSALDGNIKTLTLDTHYGKKMDFAGYKEETPEDTELLVPAPWDDLYLYWLEAQIDYYNGEYARYNNSATRFTRSLQDYCDHYNRTHMPLTPAKSFY